jgi:hypothetical protein
MARNPIDIGARIYEVLTKIFGKAFTNRMVGTQSNVIKPGALDSNAPTNNIYSKKAFNNQETLDLVEEKIMEYAPSILANKNMKQKMNFLENAENLLRAKQKQKGTDMPGLKTETETGLTKKGADVLDIKTGTKVEGIEQLKEDLGLPEGMSPASGIGKATSELKRLSKEKEILDKDTMKAIDQAMDDFFKTTSRTTDLMEEGKRRAVVREILLMDDRVNLPKEVRKSLENYDDLKRGGAPEMDPLKVLNDYFVRDNNQLDTLDIIIENATDPKKAAEEFLKRGGKFDLKVTEELSELLKKADDDPNIPEMAEGGRIGYSSGTSASIIEIMSLIETLPLDQKLQFLQMLPPSVRAEVEERLNMAEGGRIGFKNAGLSYLMGL